MTADVELLPCPFCGSADALEMTPEMPGAHFALIHRLEMRHQCAPSHSVVWDGRP